MTKTISFDVVQLGPYPATRPLGQDGRARLEYQLEGLNGVDLTINFAGIEVMNISFADEFLGKFLDSNDFSTTGTTVKVAGLNADNRYSVSVCVERRKTEVVVVEADGSLSLLGDSIMSETFDCARKFGHFKANDIADALGLSAANANNRLKRLTAAGALRKAQATGSASGGKEFVYEAVCAEVDHTSDLAPV